MTPRSRRTTDQTGRRRSFGQRARIVIAVCGALCLLASACARDSGGDETTAATSCVPIPTRSVARAWDEALLHAIRLDVPSPTVHARNLFHVSAAMWDTWASYEPEAGGVFVDEANAASDLATARDEAISFAAYRVLEARYLLSPRAEESITHFEQLMRDLCYDPTFDRTEGQAAAAVGNRIAAEILRATADDGSNEAGRYADPTYEPVNEPLPVAETGTTMVDPNRWQPLQIQGMVAQNGSPLDTDVQEFVGSHWGAVTPFALEPTADGSPIADPGPPPLVGDPETDLDFKEGALAVLRHGARLDPADGIVVDIGPATRSDAAPDSYETAGRASNPVTGQPYAVNEVLMGDFARVVAEYWADGPESETPPGHWNVVANQVVDRLDANRIGGTGPVVDALEYDVKLYLALNGAMHDSAVAAWGIKRHYDSSRPISMIRYMGQRGQSSDPEGDSYDAAGLPLEPGLVELVTETSSASGERHEHLADHVGEVAVYSWLGRPRDSTSDEIGVGWILAADWVPYQRSTFVTPAFAGYVSGHSTFSRAAAEVLTAMTGSPYFPGGLGEWVVPAGSLEFDVGPASDVVLQWATFIDAADQAGESRLYGGIHPPADDFAGRRIGALAGRAAWAEALTYFGTPSS